MNVPDGTKLFFPKSYNLNTLVEYTFSLLQINLDSFDRRSTFEAHFVKLNQHFNVNVKYTSGIL